MHAFLKQYNVQHVQYIEAISDAKQLYPALRKIFRLMADVESTEMTSFRICRITVM